MCFSSLVYALNGGFFSPLLTLNLCDIEKYEARFIGVHETNDKNHGVIGKKQTKIRMFSI